MRVIINSEQGRILGFLATVDDATNEWIRTSARVGSSRYYREIADLRERGLVNSYRPLSNKVPMRISITDDGRKALEDYTGPAHEKLVPASRISLMNQPSWDPPKNVYVRNNGNTQYPSRGIA